MNQRIRRGTRKLDAAADANSDWSSHQISNHDDQESLDQIAEDPEYSQGTYSEEISATEEQAYPQEGGFSQSSGAILPYNVKDIMHIFQQKQVEFSSEESTTAVFLSCKLIYLLCDGLSGEQSDSNQEYCRGININSDCAQYKSQIYSFIDTESVQGDNFKRRGLRQNRGSTIHNQRTKSMRGLVRVPQHAIRRSTALKSHFQPIRRNIKRHYVIRGLKNKVGVNRRHLNGGSSADQNYYVGGAATYKTIPNLIVVAEGLATIYNAIYASVPSNEDKAKQDSWDKLSNGIQTYAKIRNFAVALLVNNDKLVQDLEYVKKNVGTLSMDMDETLAFYDFRDRYNRLKLKSASLSDIFLSKEKELRANADGFTANIRSIASSVDYLLYLNQNLIKQTKFLRERSDPGTPDSIYYIQTVDQTILLIPTLIDTRADVMKALGNIKTSLYTIRDTRTKLDANLTDMEKIIDGTYDPSKDQSAMKSSAVVWPSAVLSLLVALAL
jgi:hypothetical protein